MAVSAGMIAKAAATALSNEKLRKGIGWGLVAVLSPVILLIAALCSIGTGGADHNNQAVAAAFYGTSYSTEVPMAFRSHIEEMRSAFSLLDSAVASVNGRMEGGNSLDPIRVKAVFYALCFGEDAPGRRAANRFVECFYTWETRTRTVEVESEDGTVTSTTEEYTVAVPVSLYQAYANLEAELGRTITEDDKSNINHIYTMIAGTEGGGSYSGEFLRGDGSGIDLDISAFVDPANKNAADLVTYAIHAWESGWGYVWGTYKSDAPDDVIKNWMRNRDTIEFLGLWEQLNNPEFKPVEFDGFRTQAGSNAFTMSPKKWIDGTGAVGIISKAGRYGGTFAQKDIAFEFASWISAEFKLYIIKDYQRLKNDENSRLALGWNLNRTLAKINYRIHTDAIKDVLIPPDVTPQRQSFTYANEADVLNVALFGITSKEWRQTHQDSKGNIRDEASLQQLIVLANLESINAELIRQGVPQSERLLRLNASAKQMMQSLVGDHRIDEFRTYGELPNKESK